MFSYSKAEIRQNLLGCLEVALFMRTGTSRFNASKDSLKKSFLIPLLVLPLTLATLISAHPQEALDLASANILGIIYTLRLGLYLGAFLTLVYFMASKMNRLDDFFRFATANNWLMLPVAAMLLPLSLAFLSGYYEFSEIYPLMVFITLYSYATTAFMAAHVLRIPVELACFIAIAGMAINQTSLQALKFVASQTLMMMS